MGYYDIAVRDQAVVLLNMLYDQVDWQLQEAFRPVIRSVGQHFFININVNHFDNGYKPQFYLGINCPSPLQGSNSHVLTWHRIEQENIKQKDKHTCTIDINFGKFWKCGFYDWRIVEINENGKFIPLEMIGRPDPVFPIVNNNVYDDYYD